MVKILDATFPRFDFEDGNTLLTAIGSFWAQIFEDNVRLQAEFRANGDIHLQSTINFFEAVATLSRTEIPVFHCEKWRQFILKESSKLPTAGVLKYGDGAVYGEQPGTGATFLYGTAFEEAFIFSLDINLADAAHIQNRILDPSVVLTKGIDFVVDRANKTIAFAEDPFKNTLFAARTVYGADSLIEDTELALWLPNAEFDENFLFDHFGYAIDVSAPSSEAYKAFINAFWNTLNRTPDNKDIRGMLAAMTGVETVVGDSEVVEFIEVTGGRLQIVTDKRVYSFNSKAAALVAVGDTVKVGQELVDTLEVIELSGANKDLSKVRALVMDDDFLSDGFISHVVFVNELTDLVHEGIDSDGKAFVKFDLGGFPDDVDRFWDLAQQRGKEQGATLAELLDTRENPPTDPSLPPEITQPGPEHLPSEVNPLLFLIDNLLKNNLFLIRLKPTEVVPGALGLEFFDVLRRSLPPHVTFIVLMETVAPLEIVDLGQQGGTDACIGLEDAGAGVQDEFFNDESCTSVPLINHFTGPDSRPFSEVGVTPSPDAWIESAMVRPRFVEIV